MLPKTRGSEVWVAIAVWSQRLVFDLACVQAGVVGAVRVVLIVAVESDEFSSDGRPALLEQPGSENPVMPDGTLRPN